MDMGILLLSSVLLFLPQTSATLTPNLTASCRRGTYKECRNALFVPGHTLLGAGFNILTMKPRAYSLVDLQLVNKSCTLCNNPFQNNRLQKLPNALRDWRPQMSCSRNVASSVYQSAVSLANEESSAVSNDWKVGLLVPFSKGTVKTSVAGSHSEMTKLATSRSANDKYSFLSHRMECRYYSFGLSERPALTSHFEASLRQLPRSYTGNKAAYRRLIDSYGTHYILQAEVGGRLHDVTAVRTCEVALNRMSVDNVKNCLSVEAEISANVPKSSSINTEFQRCSQKAKQSGRGSSYSQIFSDRKSEVIGGRVNYDLLSGNLQMFNKWIESLKSEPGLVSYALEPIHNLVRFKGPIKNNLVLAINDYLKDNALRKNCPCGGDCSCSCSISAHVNSDCCPTKRMEAKVHMKLMRARGLYGDYFSKTDAYVILKYGNVERRTPTIWNNDNPQWNKQFEYDMVELSAYKKLTIEVWDEDQGALDNLLGKCERPVISGNKYYTCYLNHGSITFSITARCPPFLKGTYCEYYKPSPNK